jgi:hypothetical protein
MQLTVETLLSWKTNYDSSPVFAAFHLLYIVVSSIVRSALICNSLRYSFGFGPFLGSTLLTSTTTNSRFPLIHKSRRNTILLLICLRKIVYRVLIASVMTFKHKIAGRLRNIGITNTLFFNAVPNESNQIVFRCPVNYLKINILV